MNPIYDRGMLVMDVQFYQPIFLIERMPQRYRLVRTGRAFDCDVRSSAG